jgi:tetratricopeptide (TPR) repeat protein
VAGSLLWQPFALPFAAANAFEMKLERMSDVAPRWRTAVVKARPLHYAEPDPMDDLAPSDTTPAEEIGSSGSTLASWAALAARSPADPAPLLAPIQALLAAGRLAEAGVLLDAAQFRFPDHAPFAIEAARIAQRQGATEEALRRWQSVRDRFPTSAAGLIGAAATLRDTGRAAEAEALLAAAVSRFATDPTPAIDYAGLAHARHDWPDALRRWSAVREHFPDQPQGYSGAAVAHRQLGDFDLADALLQYALERFPDVVSLVFEHGWVAHIRRDWPEAVRRWETARARAPEVFVGYTAGAVALRESGRSAEAEALLRDAAQRFPTEPRVAVEQAWLAQARRDWPEAARCWDAVRARLPGEEVAYTGGARALREQGRADEADRLLREAIERFPDRRSPLTEHAWLAHIRRDWAASVDRWAAVRAHFPDHAEAYVQAALALAELERDDEAEPLLAEGMAHRPDAVEIAVQFAWLAYRKKRWPDASERFALLRERFPNHPDGYLAGAAACRGQSLPNEAEAILLDGMERLPSSIELAVAYAAVALEREDFSAAAERFHAVAERFPGSPEGPVGVGRALARSGNVAAAESVLHETIARFPGASAPLAEFAEVAVRQQDWPEAARRWADAEARFPREKIFSDRLHEAQGHVMGGDPTAEPAAESPMDHPLAPAPKPEAGAMDRQVCDLLLQFESLGGQKLGCEFGIFQRDCGAEPLGLLRWADMPYEGLVAALESRFDGVGSEENTELFLSDISGGRGEYCIRDRRGMMLMRTFIYEDEVSFEKMYAASCRRMQFLARKLVEDLEQGNKIFVYRLTDRNLSEAELDRLHAAMRAYGDNTLLYVRYEDADHPNGTVELGKPGLLIGCIDRFKMSPTDEIAEVPPRESWLGICENAWHLWTALRA